MSEKMRRIPFDALMNWALTEYEQQGSVFGVRKEQFYVNTTGNRVSLFGEEIATPVGPAAGPNAQLAQNIIASYLGGARFMELKTVQKMDGKDLADCVPRPCIRAEDEGYNVEWSTELTIPNALEEYIKAWIALHVLAREFSISDCRDFLFNMSVGYDLAGIKGEKIDTYIESMKDAKDTKVWKEATTWLRENAGRFKRFTAEDIDRIDPQVSRSITLSTLHGCPPQEIERIAKYLLCEKKVHTYVKCNPTLLGYELARSILDDMGYGYISFDDHHFNDDLQYEDALAMLQRLMDLAKEQELSFGVKITNTFPVKIKRNELPGEEMYMSGRALYPLSIRVAAKLSEDFEGSLPVSFSGGADAFNIKELYNTGIRPITVATTILKPGGYARLNQLARELEDSMRPYWQGIDVEALNQLALSAPGNPDHVKGRREVASRKTSSKLPLFDCFKAPCKEGGCPIEQQIPEYLRLVAEGRYDDAFRIIAIDNASPSVTGTICDHACQGKCTRLDYETSLQVRQAKRLAADAAQEAYTDTITPPALRTKKRAAVVGAGPAGVAAALFLRRNGMEVTVFEKRGRPFGIVEYVIPGFRISKEAIARDFRMAEKMGVEFRFHQEIGDIPALKQDYDYVIVATGAWKAGRSPVRESNGKVLDALDFLLASKENSCKVDLGKKVAVIGGGDVAMDCSRAAKRAPGVEEVTIVYRRTVDFMPASREEIRLAVEDGVGIKELYAPVSFHDGVLHCEIMELGDYDESGRRGMVSTGRTEDMAFDTLIAATGAQVDATLYQAAGMALDKWDNPVVNAANESSIENIYIAGDGKKGPSTVVAGIGDAKRAVKDILRKEGLQDDFKRVSEPQSDELLYSRKGVLVRESGTAMDAYRCLSCDQVCELCADVCPNRANVAVTVSGFDNRRQILHIDALCNECGNCGIFCPHTGNPYKDKITLFWEAEDFADSENRGFLRTGENTYKIRLEDGKVVETALSDSQMPEEYRSLIQAVNRNYAYFNVTGTPAY